MDGLAHGYSLIISNNGCDSIDEVKTAPQQSLWLLVACFWACSLTAGIIPGRTLFSEFFANAGVFGHICKSEHQELGCDEQYLQIGMVLNLASVVVLMSGVLIGDAFDRLGGQICAVVGSLMVAVAFALIAMLVLLIPVFPSHNILLSYTTMCLVLLADIGANLNSFALLGLIWHYPDHQSLISSLVNATYLAGAFFAVGVEYVILIYKVSFAVPMISWSMAQVLVCVWLWQVIPSKAEYTQQAKLILGLPVQVLDGNDLWSKTKLACSILRCDLFAHFMLALSFVGGQTVGFYYQAIAIPFATALFDSKKEGEEFGTMCSFINGICGILVIPFVGWLADYLGLGAAIVAQVLLPAVFGFTCTLTSWSFATITAASACSYTCICFLLMNRWILYFSPPNRVGMVMGIFQAVTASLVYVFAEIGSILVICSFCSVAAGTTFGLYYFIVRPCPPFPRLLPEDEEELARTWGFNSLEEVAEILNISDQTLLIRQLTTTDIEEIKQLSIKLQGRE